MTRSPLPYAVTFLIIAATALWLYLAGRVPLCECGYVLLWLADPQSPEASQHLSDWYSPSHLIHGFLFYGALWLVARRLSLGWRLAIATLVECAWEIVENSAFVIDRYRAVTVSFDYNGDSIINAMADIGFMVLGFYIARAIPVWASVAIVIGLEVLTAIVIRDGLVLNVLMLLYPIEAVRVWQGG